MVKIIISFKKEYFYFFLFMIGIFGFILFVQAYDDSFTSGDITPLDFGHSADEIDVKVPNSSSSNPAKTLQQAIDNQDLSAWTKSGNNIFYNLGNVGIGTTGVPAQKLDVNGIVRGQRFEDDSPAYYLDMNVGGRLAGLSVDNIIQGSVSGNANYANSAGAASSVDWSGVSNKPSANLRFTWNGYRIFRRMPNRKNAQWSSNQS